MFLVSFWKRIFCGDLLAFGGSIAATIFFVSSKQIKNEFPLYFRILLMAFTGAVNMALMSILFEGSTLDFDPYTGIFGLFTPK